MRWLWIGGGLLTAVAAGGVWVATQNPEWIAGVIAGLGAAAWKALAPAIAKAVHASPETIAENKRRVREGGSPVMGRDQRKRDRGGRNG